MSICPSCQAENLASYQFCQFCGTKIAVNLPIAISDNESTNEETQPLNLEDLIEETDTQSKIFDPSQLSQVVTSEEELPEKLLQELPIEVILDSNSELLVDLTSP